jgi:bifunctional DNA-binding transcriptional regulator/antitoxin component of YhaV-PrlF toxin-antitoxin module
MKNEAKVLYRMVLDNLDILKQHKAGKIEKNTLQKKYARIMTEELEERILRALD